MHQSHKLNYKLCEMSEGQRCMKLFAKDAKLYPTKLNKLHTLLKLQKPENHEDPNSIGLAQNIACERHVNFE